MGTDLAHRVSRLAANETAIDGRAHDDDAAVCGEMRKGCLYSSVQATRIDTLHEVKPLVRLRPESVRSQVCRRLRTN